MNHKEWSDEKKWNPFNSGKLLTQVYRWKQIKPNNKIPQPALVTVDPINVCDLKCSFCNAHKILSTNSAMISEANLLEIANLLPIWKGSPNWEAGVEAVCIAGGGEPLLHPSIGKFIDRLVEKGVEVGVVTNGTQIDRYLEPLSKCTWIGVSVDAGCAETYTKIKGKDTFQKVIDNIKLLSDYSKKHDNELNKNTQGNGISFKYLLNKDNVQDVYNAVKIAKNIGCKNFHMRPAGIPWNEINNKETKHLYELEFSDIESFGFQLDKARKLEDENFGVFGVTHKFNDKLRIENRFKTCYAIFMTAVFMPSDNGDKDAVNIGLCCDRRGDDNMTLIKNSKNVTDIVSAWGSKTHWKIHDNIRIESCPRCTYQPHNQIFQHVIKKDNMTYKFI